MSNQLSLKNILQEFLLEYKEVIDLDSILQSKKDKKDVIIFWNNGIIAPRDKQMDLWNKAGGIDNIAAKVDFNKKTVNFWFMDDWSDFKRVKKIQQFLQDLIRLKLITPDYGLVIENKKVSKMNIKGTKVKNLLDYNAEFVNEIPISFHGTSDFWLPSINRFGLVPTKYDKAMQNWTMGYTNVSENHNYLTIDFSRAAYYARYTVDNLKKEYKISSKPIVIELEDIPIGLVTTDDDFMTNMGKLQLLNFLSTGKKTTTNNYIKGIRGSSQFAYNGRIPAKFIKKIHKV